MSKDVVPMTKTGFCEFPSEGSHAMCARLCPGRCSCECHEKEEK